MDNVRTQIRASIENLQVNKSNGKRSPHKPLLLLIALSKLQNGQSRLSLSDIEVDLLPLLKAYAPPVKGSHQPELPYWHLQSSGIWSVSGSEALDRQSGGFPKMSGLRNTVAGFTDPVVDYLQNQPDFVAELNNLLLDEYFPESVQDELVARLAIDREGNSAVLDSKQRRRDPAFRNKVLQAYDYRCAVTGFQAMLGGSVFGCEAAHVKWHAYDGPDIVPNGISLEPTLHKLFDAGAWTLDDDRRILVSRDFSGSDTAIQRLRDLHGQEIAKPISPEMTVDIDFIRWHREPDLGGVFRMPAL